MQTAQRINTKTLYAGAMNKVEAISKIKLSLLNGAQVIAPKTVDSDKFIEEQAVKLLSNVIEPVIVKITSACFPEYDYEKYLSSEVWAIAHDRDSWLLTLADENEFALGFGDSTNEIMMHGFSSSNALGEWCT